MSIGYITSGGGTMSGHQAACDCVAVEDFLAEFSKTLPLPEAKGDAKAANVIDRTILVIKNLRAPREKKRDVADETKRATENWTGLKDMIAEIPADDATKGAFFATDPVTW